MTAAPLRTAETHLSWLVLVGDLVLKAKKPCRTEFLDLSTREARQRVVADRGARSTAGWPPTSTSGWRTLAGARASTSRSS